MGKNKKLEIKIRNTMAQLKSLDEDFINRQKAFKSDLKTALAYKDKKTRRFELSRLHDELNGYLIRISQNLSRSEKIYSDSSKITDLSDLKDLINKSSGYEDYIKFISDINNARNRSAHPYGYFVNEEILKQSVELQGAIQSNYKKLKEIDYVTELDIRATEKKQLEYLQQKLSPYATTKKNDTKMTK